MRALCGAIITAGALIGMGLLTIAMGVRYHAVVYDEKRDQWVKFGHMDNPLIFSMVFLVALTIIGLGIAFFGLALHHERRFHERVREEPNGEAEPTTSKRGRK